MKNPLIVFNISYLILAWFCVYITPDNHDWLFFDGSKSFLIDLSILLILLTYAFFLALHLNVKKANIPALIILPLLLYMIANWVTQFLLTYFHHISYLKLKYWFAGVYCTLSCLVETRLFKKVRNVTTYDDYIKASILGSNKFGIIEITNLEDITTKFFVRSDYSKIMELIRNREFEKIKIPQSTEVKTTEYITISKFNDQNNKEYIVTSYDSDLLEQYPQVIDIFEI